MGYLRQQCAIKQTVSIFIVGENVMMSLRNLSRRPHFHPNQHTRQELQMIYNLRRRIPPCVSYYPVGEADGKRI